MKVFELLPRPLGNIFRKLTHFTCNSPENSSTEYTKPPPLIPTPRHLFAYVTWRAIIPHDGYGATVGRDKRGCGRSSFALGETAEQRELRRRRFVGWMLKAFVRRDAELDMADFPRLGIRLDHPARHRVAERFMPVI